MTNRLGLILNAHLPYVRDLRYDRFLEEDWLFEAMNETYIPLLRAMEKIQEETYSFKFTISFSPTLCCMLNDDALCQRFIEYLELHIELGEKETIRCHNDSECLENAVMYLDALRDNLDYFEEECHRNILAKFREFEKNGYLEIITTCATHAYLPVFKDFPTAVKAQIDTGINEHLNYFGKASEGFWLPECGYYPGLEDFLKNQGCSWFQIAGHSLMLGDKFPESGNYAPVYCPNGLLAFPRDYNLTSLVWDSVEGYPAEDTYREFYRDIGYDLPMEYIRKYIHEPEVRVFTGFKYWAITGNTDHKKIYNHERALQKVKEHAANFVYEIKKKGKIISPYLKDDPFYTVAFEAELFGHWWFEGIDWLVEVIKAISQESSIEMDTPSSFIKTHKDFEIMQPEFSSWGENGYSDVWVDNESNAWLFRHVFQALSRMEEIAIRNPDQSSLKRRYLNQCARESLLLMASDWPIIVHNKTSRSYALNRIFEHIDNVNEVYRNLCEGTVDTSWLVNTERRNCIFSNIDYEMFNPTKDNIN